MAKQNTPRGEEAEGGANSAKKRKVWLFALGATVLAALFFVIGWFSRWFALGERTRGLLWAVETAQDRYYRDVSEEELFDAFYDGFTTALDRYSQYFPKADYQTELDRTAGKSSGYGFTIWTSGGHAQFYAVAGNSPAERAGLRRGMYILGYGESEESVVAGSRDEITAFLDETEGPAVLRCGYLADGSDAQNYTVSPAAFQTSYCLYRDMGGSYRFDPNDLDTLFDLGGPLEGADGDTAYIRLEKFYGKAAAEFEACLSLMKERGRKHLIIDLRGNGGGYLSVFCDIASHLLKEAEGSRPVVATAKYRDGSVDSYHAPGNDYRNYFGEDSEIYILADEDTASASECLIGALVSYGTLPYDRIYLRGSNDSARTYGKGIMQSTYTDISGNALKLTVAEIFWPDGTTIHGRGVTPADGAVAVEAELVPAAGADTMLSALLGALAQ